jgi:hypothetical protein
MIGVQASPPILRTNQHSYVKYRSIRLQCLPDSEIDVISFVNYHNKKLNKSSSNRLLALNGELAALWMFLLLSEKH